MTRDLTPTDPDQEAEAGRVAVWLDPADVRFLADEWRKMPEDAPDSVRVTWERVAFRMMAALHKSAHEYEPRFPSDDEKYSLPNVGRRKGASPDRNP